MQRRRRARPAHQAGLPVVPGCRGGAAQGAADHEGGAELERRESGSGAAEGDQADRSRHGKERVLFEFVFRRLLLFVTVNFSVR